MADSGAFIIRDWMAGFGLLLTLECPYDAASERRLVGRTQSINQAYPTLLIGVETCMAPQTGASLSCSSQFPCRF